MSVNMCHLCLQGEESDSVYSQCAIEAETVTINDFFNGAEPNNQVPCDCEGEVCLADHDEEAEDRFSLKNLMAGKKEKLGPLVHRIHNGKSRTGLSIKL